MISATRATVKPYRLSAWITRPPARGREEPWVKADCRRVTTGFPDELMGATSATFADYESAAVAAGAVGALALTEVMPGEDAFAYIGRVKGSFDQMLYQHVIGAANEFKEGDQAIAVGAAVPARFVGVLPYEATHVGERVAWAASSFARRK